MVKAECVICLGNGARYSYGSEGCCLSCVRFFKKYLNHGLDNLSCGDKCKGNCSNVKKCRRCRMKLCLAKGMRINRSKGRHLRVSHCTSLDQDVKSSNLEKTPKEKIKLVPKETPKSAKKSKLSLKSSRQQQYCDDTDGPLDTWTKYETWTSQADNTYPDITAEVKKKQETESKVLCVASLHNLGNTCFLNSVLQILRYTPQFEEKLSELAKQIKLSKEEREMISQCSQTQSFDDDSDDDMDYGAWDVVIYLNEVYNKMKQAEENVLNGSVFIGTRPYDLLDAIGRLNPMFEGDQQQDAHEFLRCLLLYIQEASRSLNRYRKKAAERLGKNIDKCLIKEKSVLTSPKQVDLFGGAKTDSKTVSGERNNSQISLSSEAAALEQTSIADQGGETSSEPIETKLQLSAFKRHCHDNRLLTELQNHGLPNKKSVCSNKEVITAGSRVRRHSVGQSDVNICKENDKDVGEIKRNRSPNNKRKAANTKCTVPADDNNRLQAMEANDVSSAHKRARTTVPNESTILVHSVSDPGNYTKKNCSSAQDHQEDSHHKKQITGDQLTQKLISSEHKDPKKAPEVGQIQNVPFTKELYVRLDKNSIAKYFKKILKPKNLADIERHLEPVSDCIEELFQGSVELWTRCCECEKVTTRQEDYQDISVAVHLKHEEEEDEGWQCTSNEPKNVDGPVSEKDQDSGEHLEEDVNQAANSAKNLRSSVSQTEEDFSWIKQSLGEVEHLRDDSKYWCDSCCHLSEAERSMHYKSVPKVLTLHLKRFAVLNGSHRMFTKLTHHMPLPMVLPCIEDECSTPNEHRLQLYGIIMHTGSTLSGGHYTAYVRAPANSPSLTQQSNGIPSELISPTVTSSTASCTSYWFACDDDTVKLLPEHEFLSLLKQGSKYTMTPYLLFYHRM